MDRAVSNKETRTITRITKNIRKYRNVIKPHHIAALYEAVGFPLPESIKNSPHFSQEFTEKLELNKNVVARISKTLEL